MKPLPLKSDFVKETYNSIANKYNELYLEKDPKDCKRVIQKFISLVPKKSKILDAGSGIGNYSKIFSEHGYTVIGLDFSDEMINISKKNDPKAKFYKGDIISLPFHDKSFDAIWCHFVLVNLTKADVKKTIKEFYRVLKPDGILYFNYFNGDIEEIIPESLDPTNMIRRAQFTEKFIDKVLEQCNFKQIEKLNFSYEDKQYFGSFENIKLVFAKKV